GVARRQLVYLEGLARLGVAGREDAEVVQEQLRDVVGAQESLLLRIGHLQNLGDRIRREARELESERVAVLVRGVRRLAPRQVVDVQLPHALRLEPTPLE